MECPDAMFGMRYRHLHSEIGDGMWELHSYLRDKAGKTEYNVSSEACDGTLPMDKDALHALLADSEVA